MSATESAASVSVHLEAGEGSSVASAPITSAGDDMRDNALGSGNLVLHDITIAEGGMLVVGQPAADAPPGLAALQRALATYLKTLLQRYRLLSLQGLGGGQQLQVALQAVFINLTTNVQLADFAHLRGDARMPPQLDDRSARTRANGWPSS